MIGGRRATPPPHPIWYGRDSWGGLGRPNLTNIMVLGPGGAQTLQIQWFWRLEAPKPYKYNGLGAWRRPDLANTLVLAPGGAQTIQIQQFWRLLYFNDFQWFSIIFNDFHWFSLILIDFHWFLSFGFKRLENCPIEFPFREPGIEFDEESEKHGPGGQKRTKSVRFDSIRFDSVRFL